jgi:pilus assembly protein CpaC
MSANVPRVHAELEEKLNTASINEETRPHIRFRIGVPQKMLGTMGKLVRQRCWPRLGAVLLLVTAAVLLHSLPVGATGRIHQITTGNHLVNLEVVVNKAETISSDESVGQVLIGNSEIADVVVLTNQKLYVLGKKLGVTSVTVLGPDKNVVAVLNVRVTHDLDELRRRLGRSLPGSTIMVEAVNNGIFLTGVAESPSALHTALQIANQVAPKAVTHAITVRGSQQVLLEVRFIEASRDAARDLGVGWEVLGKNITAATGISNFSGGAPLFGLASNNTPFGVAIARVLNGGTTADVVIQALEKRGVARRLAEPNLVAQSGQKASFLAGGEFPFPVQSDKDTISVEFKKFGVGLNFTPTVLGEGKINLVIEPEVSELDPTTSLRAGGVEIPSLTVRRASTTIELRDGQSFAMAGLLQSNNFKNRRQIPWLGQVPVIGALLASSSFQKKQTELVIIVTPRLVKPKRPGPHQKIKTPLDGRVAANDPEFFLKGKLELTTAAAEPYVGHILHLRNEAPVGANYKTGTK